MKPFRPTTLNKFLWIAFLAISLIWSVRWLQVALPQYLPKDWAQAHDLDALVDYRGARLAIQGKSPYTSEGMREISVPLMGHPPTTQFWFLPLARFDKPLAAELLSLAVWFLLIPHVYLCCRELKFPAPIAFTSLSVSAILTTTWMIHHFHVIQLSEHIAFAYVLAWVYLRRGEDGRAGVALGFAACLKLFPGLMLIFLLLGRRWRAFIAASATFLVAAVVMTRIYGFDSWRLFFKQQGPNADDWIGNVRNSSLFGIVARLINPICIGKAHPGALTTAIGVGASLALIAVACLVSWKLLRKARFVDRRAIDMPFALFSLLSVFLNVWAWEHYYVFLIQPAMVVLATLWRGWVITFRGWDEERASGRALAIKSLLTVAAISALLLVAYVSTWDIAAKEKILGYWMDTRNLWYHRHLHLIEIGNFLPWIILIGLCMLCSPSARMLSSTGIGAGPIILRPTDPTSRGQASWEGGVQR